MPARSERARDVARILLASIRLFNGAVALLAPAALARRLEGTPEANPAVLYALRLFGVRTVVIGAELLLGDEAQRARSLRTGVAIHASDATAAVVAGVRRQLPARVAATAALISIVNTALALTARPRRP